MGKINAEWHKANKMPERPTEEQRLKWHAEHAKNCECRKPTGKLLETLKARKMI